MHIARLLVGLLLAGWSRGNGTLQRADVAVTLATGSEHMSGSVARLIVCSHIALSTLSIVLWKAAPFATYMSTPNYTHTPRNDGGLHSTINNLLRFK